MPEKTWTTSENDLLIARSGFIMQAEGHLGEFFLDHAGMDEFMDNMIEAIAALHAQNRFLQNTIHRYQEVNNFGYEQCD